MYQRFFSLVFCLLSCITSNAQASNKEIESSIDALNKAMISQDKMMLEKITADELSYGHSTGLIENKTEFENNILNGPEKFTTIENTSQHIQIATDVAIVRCISSIKANNNGALLDIKIGVLMIWKQQGGNWKLLARQGYKLPQ